MINTNELIEVAESLPSDLKIQLIDRLLNSLNPSEMEIDKLWAIEVENRIEEVKKSYIKPIPGEDVFRDIQVRIGDEITSPFVKRET